MTDAGEKNMLKRQVCLGTGLKFFFAQIFFLSTFANYMKKALAYLLSLLYLMVFFILITVFHPIQVICWKIWGYEAQKNR